MDRSISADGNLVAFTSAAANLIFADSNVRTDIFVRDVAAANTRRASVTWLGAQIGEHSSRGRISRDGRLVTFVNAADSVTSGDFDHAEDVFSFDRVNAGVRRISTSAGKSGGNGVSDLGTLAGHRRYVAFRSDAADLGVPDPTPGARDVYLKDLETNVVEIVSWASGQPAAAVPGSLALSADGRFVAFVTPTGLVAGDADGQPELYVRDRGAIVYTTPCAGDGTSAPCPCSNPGSPGNGCENYGLTGGARMSATGNPSVTGDTVQLQVVGLPPYPAGLAFGQGTLISGGGLGVPFGDGVRCLGGQTLRLRVRTASNGESAYGYGVPGDAPVSAAGHVGAAGGTFFYQVPYRSVGSFCFQQKLNWSNAIAIVWQP